MTEGRTSDERLMADGAEPAGRVVEQAGRQNGHEVEQQADEAERRFGAVEGLQTETGGSKRRAGPQLVASIALD